MTTGRTDHRKQLPHQQASSEQGELGGVGVQTDLMFSWRVRREGEPPLGAVLTRQDHLQDTEQWDTDQQLLDQKVEVSLHLVVRILDFHEHAQTLRGGQVLLPLLVVQLRAVVSCRHTNTSFTYTEIKMVPNRLSELTHDPSRFLKISEPNDPSTFPSFQFDEWRQKNHLSINSSMTSGGSC